MNNESGIMNDGKITSFTKLDAWKEAHKLVLLIYQLTKTFPKEEVYALVDQLRRAAISIVSNIAEGFSRQSYKETLKALLESFLSSFAYKEKVQFYSMAKGSLTEIQSQLLVARDLNYMSKENFDEAATQTVIVHKLLNGLIRSSKDRIINKELL